MNDTRVNIFGEPEGWILGRMARELRDRLPDVVRVDWIDTEKGLWRRPAVSYAINYGYARVPGWGRAQWRMALFTHRDPASLQAVFDSVAHNSDMCVAMSSGALRDLAGVGVPSVKITKILPGVPPCFLTSPPVGPVGVLGRSYLGGRKGEKFLSDVIIALKGFTFTGTLVPDPCVGFVKVHLNRDVDRLEFYRRIGCLLVPGPLEGGPIPALEAAACKKPVVMPDVGFACDLRELGANVVTYPWGDVQAAAAAIRGALGHVTVRIPTWEDWAAEHYVLWTEGVRGLLEAQEDKS